MQINLDLIIQEKQFTSSGVHTIKIVSLYVPNLTQLCLSCTRQNKSSIYLVLIVRALDSRAEHLTTKRHNYCASKKLYHFLSKCYSQNKSGYQSFYFLFRLLCFNDTRAMSLNPAQIKGEKRKQKSGEKNLQMLSLSPSHCPKRQM